MPINIWPNCPTIIGMASERVAPNSARKSLARPGIGTSSKQANAWRRKGGSRRYGEWAKRRGGGEKTGRPRRPFFYKSRRPPVFLRPGRVFVLSSRARPHHPVFYRAQ